jgi:hypothetical protein
VQTSATDGAVERVEGAHPEAIDLVPPGLRSWWSSVSPRLTGPDRAAVLLALGQVPLLLMVLVPGSLYLDDLRAQADAAGRAWWPFVIESNGTHFSPVARTLDWLHVQLAPLAHWPAVTITVAIRVALVLVAWRLFRELFGPRVVLLLPLSVLVVTPTLLPPTVWYRQSITSLLVVIALCVASQQHLRFLRTGELRNIGGALLAITGGLLTFEKAALISPWLVILTAAAMPSGTSLRNRLKKLWSAKFPLIAYVVPVALHLFVYLTGPYDKGSTAALQGTDVVRMMRLQLSEALLPGLLGGPWRWKEASPYYGNPAPPTILIIFGLLMTATLGLWAYRRDRRRAFWATALFIAYYLPAAGMVAAGRLAAFGDGVALNYRLWPDVTFVAVLCACLAVLPLRAESSDERSSNRGGLASGRLVVYVGAVVVSSVVSTVTFAERWQANPTGDYVNTLQQQLKGAASRPVRLAPVSLPNAVMPFWVGENFSVEDLLAPTEGLATFHNTDGPVLVPDNSGTLVPLQLRPHAAADAGPDGFCGYGVRPGQSREIPLPPTPYYADEMVQLGVLASHATTLAVTVVSDSSSRSVVTRAPLATAAGPHRFLVRVPYGTRVSAIRVRATDPEATVCVVLAALVVPADRP